MELMERGKGTKYKHMEQKKRVFVVEDEEEIADIILRYLRNEGYDVTVFHRGDTALDGILQNPPDLIVLDIMLPGVDGMQLLMEIRKTLKVPVIFTSAKKEEVDRILGIELGGDDYMTKPFSFRELVARVKSIFRRIDFDTTDQSPQERELIRTRNLTLDLDSRMLCAKDFSTGLTASEFSIIKSLMSRPGRTYTREELQYCLSEGERAADTRAIDIHIKNLRKKIEDCGLSSFLIQSVRGVGYRYED